MTETTKRDEREAFEAWFADADIGDLAFGRDGECYVDWDTQVAWRGWKAARAASQTSAADAEIELQRFDEWFDDEYPLDDEGGRPRYSRTGSLDLMVSAWQARAALATAPEQAGEAAVRADNEVLDWLETEISAVSCWHHGTPSYEHDANWMKDRALRLIGEARKSFAPPPASTNRLTDDQIRRIWLIETGTTEQDSPLAILDFARAIIAATEGK